MKRLTLMSMVVVAGLLVALAIALSFRGGPLERVDCGYVAGQTRCQPVGDDAELHRLCKMVRWSDPEWWKEHCKI